MPKLLDISEIKDLTHTINLMTNKKGIKSDMSNLQTRWKKLRMYRKVEIELSINDNTKSRQIYTLSQFLRMS